MLLYCSEYIVSVPVFTNCQLQPMKENVALFKRNQFDFARLTAVRHVVFQASLLSLIPFQKGKKKEKAGKRTKKKKTANRWRIGRNLHLLSP